MFALDKNLLKKNDLSLHSESNGAFAPLIYSIYKESPQNILLVLKDDIKAERAEELLKFMLPAATIHKFPAYDCFPYDVSSPSHQILAERLRTLFKLTEDTNKAITICSSKALLRKTLPKSVLKNNTILIRKSMNMARDDIVSLLIKLGYNRTSIANEAGEFAVRGSIIDIATFDEEHGYRIDFFGNNIEQIRLFDLVSQVSSHRVEEILLLPASEVIIDKATFSLFSERFLGSFGEHARKLQIFEALEEGRSYQGIEHYLPFFYEETASILDYAKPELVIFDHNVSGSLQEELQEITQYYEARRKHDLISENPYRPIGPELSFLGPTVMESVKSNQFIALSKFQDPNVGLIPLPINHPKNYFQTSHILKKTALELLKEDADQNPKKHYIIMCFSEGSLSRLSLMFEHQEISVNKLLKFADLAKAHTNIHITLLRNEDGFDFGDIVLLSEEMLFGEKIVRMKVKKHDAARFLGEVNSLRPDDIIVHKDHGIGKFLGLTTITVEATPHDFIELLYDNGDKLYVPVENINLISFYGSSEGVKLDRLGSIAWQERKARLKHRIREAAKYLMEIAAKRKAIEAPILHAEHVSYEEFCSRFPYSETEDQLRAIEDIRKDLEKGEPADRLICGDVGFGKTEVALRAAFMAVAENKARLAQNLPRNQVAILVPTTLLARQHFKTFHQRFTDFGYKVETLSRLVSPSEASKIRMRIENGDTDIVIGTHGLISDQVRFKNLVLSIVDEEQHFGVKQKEKLKISNDNVHVLTLSATPIPRTLQMSLTGVKELSLITTPPIDRIAIATFIIPFDILVIREALLKEHFRGGRSFFICPRVSDLKTVEEMLTKHVPELKFVSAHGKMLGRELDDLMTKFYDGVYDVLIATSIIESGLDVPGANTMIVYKADHFGLAQLYQIRGRVGRGKLKAYAYFTVPTDRQLRDKSLQRLEVIQKLDNLGAGFTVASSDMDIRGFGNLVGEEQSGHIKEVGIELYQSMLEEAVLELKQGKSEKLDESFSPSISLGISVLIPETYITDINLRLGFYRTISELKKESEVEALAAEMIDRFGIMPLELLNLIEIIKLKMLCLEVNVEKVDIGSEGFVFSFYKNKFSKPDELLALIAKNRSLYKITSTQKLYVIHSAKNPEKRINFVRKILSEIRGLL